MNETVRCAVCDTRKPRGEMLRVGLGHVCGPSCIEAARQKARDKRERRLEHRKERRRANQSIPEVVRRRVLARDGQRCRWCGSEEVQLHHIEFRSEGGAHVETNLVALCNEHHRLVHSDKGVYQPLLQEYIRRVHEEHQVLTLPQLQRWLLAEARREGA